MIENGRALDRRRDYAQTTYALRMIPVMIYTKGDVSGKDARLHPGAARSQPWLATQSPYLGTSPSKMEDSQEVSASCANLRRAESETETSLTFW
jgi:hypothetical protein